MKFKKIFSCLLALALILNFVIYVSAHPTILEVEYDACVPNDEGDGIDECWYVFVDEDDDCWHLSHMSPTIKYYFFEYNEENYSWTSCGISEAEANDIKVAYANSMKKWNNVYFYSTNASGDIVKNKLINIVEGTAADHDIAIFPKDDLITNIATTSNSLSRSNELVEDGVIEHFHETNWEMYVNVKNFKLNNNSGNANVEQIRERTGAHEIGHVLGLLDVDKNNFCNSNSTEDHHSEILMGYGDVATDKAVNITYKDIAGVAITRGFHTDNDHKWLNCGIQSDNTYKLICSICNGVKYVDSLSGYSYHTYNACNGNHNVSSGNMMAVASYGDQDYYKCRYCRYVAPFSSIVDQNYTKTYYSDSLHQCVNNVAGLEYTFYEEHTFVNDECTECGAIHNHLYTDHYSWQNNTQHKCYCSCGEYLIAAHLVRAGSYNEGDQFATCLLCGGLAAVGETIHPYMHQLPRTQNGSYILSNGVIVLVDEDMDAYLAGSLTFYTDDTNVTE